MTRSRIAIVATLAAVLGAALFWPVSPPTLAPLSDPGSTGPTAAPTQDPPATSSATAPVKSSAGKGDAAVHSGGVPQAAVQVMPGDNEGLIALTKRTCGTSATWVAQGQANGISGPQWIVRSGRYLTIDCTLTPVAAPVVVAPVAAWAHPTGDGCIVPNGSREFGADRGTHMHGGIDLGAPAGVYAGDPIYAMHSGTAHHGWQPSGAGTYVWVDHHDGSSSWYFHMSSRAVGDGAWVGTGQTIGYVGISGNAQAYHLHLEVKVGGTRVDPVRFGRDRGMRLGC